MADTKKINVVIGGNASNLQQASKKAKKSLGGIDKAAGALGGALAGAFGGAVLIAGIGRAITKIAEFESTMRRVSIISKGNEKELSKLALTLGSSTVFTANQAGEAMTFLAQAGFKANQILKATPGVLELAAAAQLDLGRAADIASNVLSAYGLEANEINRVNDILVTTTNNANTNVEQFAEAFKVVGPIAKAAGVSLNETASLIGVLGDAGIQGSLAGTQLKVAISTLINPSEKAAKQLAQLGVETKNADGSMRVLTDIFADLRDANLTAEQAFEIFEQRAASGALVMAGAAEKAAELAIQTEEVGVAADQSAKQLDTLKGDITLLGSAWDGLIMQGGAANSVMRGGVQVLTDLLNGYIGVGGQMRKVRDHAESLAEAQKKLNEENLVTQRNEAIINDALKLGTEELRERVKALAEVAELEGVTNILKEEIVRRDNEAVAALAALNEQQMIYLAFKNQAIEADLLHGEGLANQIISLSTIDDKLSATNNLLASFANWQVVSKKNTDAATLALQKQEDVLSGRLLVAINSITFALSDQGSAWQALGNVILNTVQQIINAMLAKAIASMIARESRKGVFGLITAAAGVAAIKVMFNNIPGFAEGGIVPGNSFSGDNVPIRVNSGEMVLNKRQQAGLLNGRGGGNVVINVSGFVGDEYQLARQIEIALDNQSANVARTI